MRRFGASPLVVLLGAAFAGSVAAQTPDTGSQVGDPAPIIEVNDLDGHPVDLGQWIGQTPVYLQFWATWCERCEALMPTVREAAARFGDSVKFIGINVAVSQSLRRVRRYLEKEQPPWMPLYDNLGTSQRAFNVPTTSWVIIIDREGVIRYVGVGGEQDFISVLEQVTQPAEEGSR